MAKKDKELLLKDLAARFPYGVVLDVDTTDWRAPQGHIQVKIEGYGVIFKDLSLIVNGSYYGDNYKPYLRPMSSMTEEERKEYNEYLFHGASIGLMSNTETAYELIDWLNKNHFDYRGLIEMGLAIPVTKENNPYEVRGQKNN